MVVLQSSDHKRFTPSHNKNIVNSKQVLFSWFFEVSEKIHFVIFILTQINFDHADVYTIMDLICNDVKAQNGGR